MASIHTREVLDGGPVNFPERRCIGEYAFMSPEEGFVHPHLDAILEMRVTFV